MIDEIRWGKSYMHTEKGELMHAYRIGKFKHKALCGYGTQPKEFAKSQQFEFPLMGDCGVCWQKVRELK